MQITQRSDEIEFSVIMCCMRLATFCNFFSQRIGLEVSKVGALVSAENILGIPE
jgi:hypothetical protein